MTKSDGPLFDLEFGLGEPLQNHSEAISDEIRRLVEDQPFCVLCTQGDTQPYGSLISYASTGDLKHFFFTTSIDTRKFRLLAACDRAALFIDSRSRHPNDPMGVEALTVTGRTRYLRSSKERETGIERLAGRHPYLNEFIRSETTALFRFDVIRYIYVTRFQQVRQWIP